MVKKEWKTGHPQHPGKVDEEGLDFLLWKAELNKELIQFWNALCK